ncbi:MAG: hypothetical protein KDB35_17895 [Acidimicrobiales bacterium]|nr:hypothetical protein [Acidimicrobiales bacterium]
MPHRRALCGPASRRRRLLPAVIGSVLAFVGAIALAPTALGQQSSSTAAPSTTALVIGGGSSPSTTSTSSPPPADDATTETTEATDETEAVPLPVAGGSSFPAETVASVPPTGAEAPLALGAVYKVTGSSDDNPTIAVQFREPFELPTDAEYRVSVLVGNPTARRMRSSMIVTDGDLTSRVEIGDGASFEQLTPVPPPTFDPSGLAALTVPVVEAPAGGALWVEVVYGDGLAISPYYSLDAVLGRSSDGKVASSPFGRVATADGGPSDETATMPPGPRLTVVNQSIILESTTPTATELLGRPVTSATDVIVIAPDFADDAARTAEIRVDRTTGTITLLDGLTTPPEDRSDASQTWIVEGLPADPSAPGRVVFDLSAVLDALGVTSDAAGPALGLRREFVLSDGANVTADAVLATTSWFAANAVVESTAPPISSVAGAETTSSSSTPSWLTPALIAAGVALVLVLLSVVVMLRRRKADADAADVLGAMAAEVEEQRRTREHRAVGADGEPLPTGELPPTTVRTGELPVVPEHEPRVVVDAADTEAAGLTIVTVEDLQSARPDDAAPAIDAPIAIFDEQASATSPAEPAPVTPAEPAVTPVEPAADREPPAAPPRAPSGGDRRFAALDSELDELLGRLGALDDDQTGGGQADGPA